MFARPSISINGYKAAEYISSGSFADAYRAESIDGDKHVIKILRTDAPAEGRPRFANEIWALKRLDHKAIPIFKDAGEYDGRPYIAMSLAPGRSLRRQLAEPVGERGTFGENKVLRIVKTLLDTICNMQNSGVTHRDIKDDNVIFDIDSNQTTLIDFGFCKGSEQPADADSFYQVGAPRYSPPSKLRFPSVTHPTHDVFAVGVLAYLLLTDTYPWSVSADLDHGFLAATMTEIAPIRVTELNSVVSFETAQLVDSMIDFEDNRRLSALEACKQAESILINSDHKKLKYPSHYSGVFPKVTRDPVHGDIRLTKYEFEILDTLQFQKLRYIKQLGFANLAYPGAQHTRFSHSVGTMHTADRIVRSIEESSGVKVDPEERLLIRSYALIHDVSHIPFGHTIEDELGFFPRHDSNKPRMERIFGREPRLKSILDSTSFGREIFSSMTDDESSIGIDLAKEIVGGHAGADVLDYIDRDALFCGVDHHIDTAIYRSYKIVRSASSSNHSIQHLVSKMYGSRGLRLDTGFAIETLLLQRYAMFLKVYSHPAKISAGAMLGKALQYVVDKDGIEKFELTIESMGDDELLLWLRDSRKNAISAGLAEGLINRVLYKPAYIAAPLPADDIGLEAYRVAQERMAESSLNTPNGRMLAERQIAERAGIDEKDLIIYWPREAPGLQKAKYYVQESPGAIPSAVTARNVRRIIERHLALWKIRVLVHPDLDKQKASNVALAASSFFENQNQIMIS